MKTKQLLRLQSTTILISEIVATKLRPIPKDLYAERGPKVPKKFQANLLIRLRTTGEGMQFPFRTMAEARKAHERVDKEWHAYLNRRMTCGSPIKWVRGFGKVRAARLARLTKKKLPVKY